MSTSTIKKYDWFKLLKNPEHYNVVLTLDPNIYGYVKANAIVAKKDDNKMYRLTRTLDYNKAFVSMRDRMFAGLLAVYDKVFELLSAKTVYNSGDMENYFAIAVETNNDIRSKVFSFDLFILKAKTYQDLIVSPEFLAIPDIENKEKHTGIFNFGFQYEKDMELIDVLHKVFHIESFQDPETSITMWPLVIDDKEFKFDINDTLCKEAIRVRLNENRQMVYYLGLEVEDIEYVEEPVNENPVEENNSIEKVS